MADRPEIDVAALRRAVEKAVRDTAVDVLAEAKRQVPRKDGILRRSGVQRVQWSGERIEAQLSFNTPYAAIQHEDRTFRHPRGGKAKYLEDPIKEYAPKLRERLEDALRNTLNDA
jgi:hypothetical protein